MSAAVSVSTFNRRWELSALVRPISNCSTSKRPLYSTTVSKIRSMRCESIRWPSASTTSCCMGMFQDNAVHQIPLDFDPNQDAGQGLDGVGFEDIVAQGAREKIGRGKHG